MMALSTAFASLHAGMLLIATPDFVVNELRQLLDGNRKSCTGACSCYRIPVRTCFHVSAMPSATHFDANTSRRFQRSDVKEWRHCRGTNNVVLSQYQFWIRRLGMPDYSYRLISVGVRCDTLSSPPIYLLLITSGTRRRQMPMYY